MGFTWSFISVYGARALLYETWSSNPSLFELLLWLFDRSEFLAEMAIRTPDLVDELELSGRLRRQRSTEEILKGLRHGCEDNDQRLWLRRYHQAVASFDPAGYRWPRPVPARFTTRLVSHNDVHPANLVFRDGRAVALIDFDLAGPGSAIWDFAAAARYWAPLQDEQDITDSRQGRALERFRIFLHASGLRRADRRQVAEAVVVNHDWTYAIVTEAAAAGHRGFADHWRMVAEHATRARRWCQRHQRDLIAAAR